MTGHARLEARVDELELQVADLYGRILGEVPTPSVAIEASPAQGCICNVGHTQGKVCPVHGPHPATQDSTPGDVETSCVHGSVVAECKWCGFASLRLQGDPVEAALKAAHAAGRAEVIGLIGHPILNQIADELEGRKFPGDAQKIRDLTKLPEAKS